MTELWWITNLLYHPPPGHASLLHLEKVDKLEASIVAPGHPPILVVAAHPTGTLLPRLIPVADTGARDVAAGETVDCSDVPSAQTEVPDASGMPDGRQRHPCEDESETGTAAVTAAVGAIGLQDEASVDGGNRERRVRFSDEMGSDGGRDSGGDHDGAQDGDADEGMQEEEEEELGREEVARILSENFLAGLEKGVDYRSVDEDERLDDLDQLSRDEVRFGSPLAFSLLLLLHCQAFWAMSVSSSSHPVFVLPDKTR